MPISLESNSATMLINQCAHGPADQPGNSRSISRSVRNRASTTTNERTNNEPFCGSGQWREGGNALLPPLSHSDHFRFRSYKHLALRFLAIVRDARDSWRSRDCRKVTDFSRHYIPFLICIHFRF